MTVISILGSCRQTYVAKHFNTTSLHDLITYPHYSKETLQAIRFIKYNNIKPENTSYVFRTCFINNQRPILDMEKIQHAYNSTDIFLVEIASKLSYEYNGFYLHHIASEQKHGFKDYKNVKIRDLSDEEIEEDLINIRNELYPKKMILVTHITTYTSGKRYELTKLLERLANKINIPIINPTQLLNTHRSDQILTKEPVLAHYSEIGQTIIADLYKKSIDSLLSSEKKNVICQTYYTSPEKIKKHSTQGFGDFLRGTIHLFQMSKQQNFHLDVSFSNHALSNFLYSRSYRSIAECENVAYKFVGRQSKDWKKETLSFTQPNIFTNEMCDKNIDDDTRKFILEQCLSPRISFTNKFEQIKKEMAIFEKDYCVVHIRCGDTFFTKTQLDTNLLIRCSNLMKKILETENNQNKKIVIMSDYYPLQNKIASTFNCLHYDVGNYSKLHTGEFDSNDETNKAKCENSLIDFFLLLKSKCIYQMVIKSAFSEYAAILSNIPITYVG